MSDSVTISYSITEEEWERTSEMRWGEAIYPTYYCFFGLVSFQVAGHDVFGGHPIDISVADLAVGLASIYGELRTGAVGSFRFEQSDDSNELCFSAELKSVEISHNYSADVVWTCERASLETALLGFIVSFTDEAARRVPNLFEWRDLEILRTFASVNTRVE